MKILITRKASSEFKDYCQSKNWQLVDESFIEFQKVEFQKPNLNNFDWILFTSKNSVQFFFDAIVKPNIDDLKIAAIGKGTNTKLSEFGVNANFIGEGSDTIEIANAFYNGNKNAKVYYPTSNLSLKTFAKQAPTTAFCKVETIYNTIPVAKKYSQNFDVLAFSSPSNVKGFLSSNEIDKSQKIISWGVVTTKALIDNSIQPTFTLKTPSEHALIQVLADLKLTE